MSLRPNAPYRDSIEDDGATLIYEGHDIPRSERNPNPKQVDQPEFTQGGAMTENGRFHWAAQRFKRGVDEAERVRVYEKIHQGIWSYNGLFRLVDSWTEKDMQRLVFKFKLVAVEEEPSTVFTVSNAFPAPQRRIIPTKVKLDVWKRDKGRCVMCGATDELHFDHVIPISKGGTSLTAENIQLLCARHNLEKRDRLL
jgi:hypothetical protein